MCLTSVLTNLFLNLEQEDSVVPLGNLLQYLAILKVGFFFFSHGNQHFILLLTNKVKKNDSCGFLHKLLNT